MLLLMPIQFLFTAPLVNYRQHCDKLCDYKDGLTITGNRVDFVFRSTYYTHRLGICVHIREYKSREVAQSPIYVIVHSLLEVSFCTQPFPTPNCGLWYLWFLTLVI